MSEDRASTRLQQRRLIVTAVAFAFPVMASIAPPTIDDLSPWGVRVLSVVIAGLILWMSEAMPIAATSLGVVAMLALVGPGTSDEALKTALAGFESPAPYFLLCALALGAATVKTGLARRLAQMLVRGARGSGRRLYAQMMAMMPPMAVLVPSALTRTAMLIPTYESVFQTHRIRRGHPLPRLVMIGTAILQPLASTAVLTGGAVPVVASSLVGGMSWAHWFVLMSVPMYTILIIVGISLFLLYRPGELPAAIGEGGASTPALSPMSAAEWRGLVIIGATTTLWLTDFIHHLNPAVPALIGATALFLPLVGVLRWEDFEEGSPWVIFLVTASSLSLASALNQSGAAAWVAATIVDQVPLETFALVPQLLVLMAIVAVVNAILPNRTAVLGITIPLLMSLAGPLGLNPVVVGLMAPIISQTTIFYPVQLATALITYRTRHYAAGELARAGVILTIASVTTILLVALPWWGLMGESVRP
ncbi:MAG: SLC13 family permease [Thermomicrobiales bacterium]